jgi:hypothetical protein
LAYGATPGWAGVPSKTPAKAPAKPTTRPAAKVARDVAQDVAEQAAAKATAPAASSGAAGAAGAAGPWYTCGLGGALLAQSALAFGLVVALSYAVAAYLAWLLLWLFWLLLFGSCAATPCGCSGSSSGASHPCCSGGPCGCGSSSSSGSSGSCCGSTSSTAQSATSQAGKGVDAAPALPAVGAAAWLGRAALGGGFAHHPDHPDFAQDTYRFLGARWCVGCFTAWPAFLAVSGILLLAQPVAWAPLLPAGLALAAAQGLSSLGLARRRAQKAAVKAALGAGLACAVSGVVLSPWAPPLKAAALGALLALALLSSLPRARRMAAWHAARAGAGEGESP